VGVRACVTYCCASEPTQPACLPRALALTSALSRFAPWFRDGGVSKHERDPVFPEASVWLTTATQTSHQCDSGFHIQRLVQVADDNYLEIRISQYSALLSSSRASLPAHTSRSQTIDDRSAVGRSSCEPLSFSLLAGSSTILVFVCWQVSYY
jgi:hypothetical protein